MMKLTLLMILAPCLVVETGYALKKCLTVSNGFNLEECQEPLGLEDYTIPDQSLSSFSDYDSVWSAKQGRLNNPQGYCWLAKTNDINQWFGVRFNQYTVITKVATQGRLHQYQWVKSYTIKYSEDGVIFKPYMKDGVVQVFPGNAKLNDLKTNIIDPPIIAKAIRIHPQEWFGHIALRVELYGCKDEFA